MEIALHKIQYGIAICHFSIAITFTITIISYNRHSHYTHTHTHSRIYKTANPWWSLDNINGNKELLQTDCKNKSRDQVSEKKNREIHVCVNPIIELIIFKINKLSIRIYFKPKIKFEHIALATIDHIFNDNFHYLPQIVIIMCVQYHVKWGGEREREKRWRNA